MIKHGTYTKIPNIVTGVVNTQLAHIWKVLGSVLTLLRGSRWMIFSIWLRKSQGIDTRYPRYPKMLFFLVHIPCPHGLIGSYWGRWPLVTLVSWFPSWHLLWRQRDLLLGVGAVPGVLRVQVLFMSFISFHGSDDLDLISPAPPWWSHYIYHSAGLSADQRQCRNPGVWAKMSGDMGPTTWK